MAREFHPVANIFPMLGAAELRGLAEDIRANGLRVPIVLHADGRILDGRNRALACDEAGVQPTYETWSGDGDAVKYVVSLNLHRRHLDEGQRAAVAGRIANLGEGRPKETAQICAVSTVAPISQAEAAELLNVSRRSVQHAAKVLNHGTPELLAAVDAGEVAVSVAAEIAKLPHDEQPAELGRVIHRANFTGEQEWFTPPEFIEAARVAMGAIDLDPATCAKAQETVKAERYFTADDDGLARDWHGRVWMNPPYSQPAISQFVDKLVESYLSGEVTEAIALTHNYTDTSWFHRAASAARWICFTRGRIRFVSASGQLAAPTQGQAFFYFGQNPAAFRGAFAEIGLLVEVVR